MKSWYSISLGDGIMASQPRMEIQEAFNKFYFAAGKPLDMAVFTRSDTEGRLHCEVLVYFSPAAVAVADEFDAQPCEQPVRSGLGLLAGDERVWSVLFNESIDQEI